MQEAGRNIRAADEKNRRLPVFYALTNDLFQCLNRLVESALVSSRLVLVDDALV